MRSTFLGSSVTSLKPAGFRDLVPAGRITLKPGRASATVSSVWSTRCNSYPSSPTSGQHGQNLQASDIGCPYSCSADVLLGVGCLPGGLRAAGLAHRVGCRVTPSPTRLLRARRRLETSMAFHLDGIPHCALLDKMLALCRLEKWC